MKADFVNHDLKVPYVVEKMIQRKIHKLEKMLFHYQPDQISLHSDLSYSQKKKMFEQKLQLHLSNARLVAEGCHETVSGACGNAYIKLFSLVEDFKTGFRNKSGHERKKGKAEIALASGNSALSTKNKLADFFSKNYRQFYNYTLREIRFRCYQGYTKPGTITVRDILDDSLAQVADRLNHIFNEAQARRICFDEIRKGIEKQLNPGGIGVIPMEQVIEPENIDEHYQEYYQPDEILKVEDILIDENAEIPEQKVEYEEIETYIDRLISQLPSDWRESFILVEREGLPAEELAKTRNVKVEMINRDILMAKKFLKEKLMDSGFEWKKNA